MFVMGRLTFAKCTLIFLLLCFLIALQIEGATKEKLAEFVRNGHSAWNSHDVDAIVNAFTKYDAKPVGFGYRTAPWRDGASRSEESYRKAIVQFFDQMEYYRTEFEELHTSVDGDIGLAWGVFVENFKPKGQPSERAVVRFTVVFKKETDGWRRLLFHRDIQPFDEQGRYINDHTKVSHEN